jgi:hypothetical protein
VLVGVIGAALSSRICDDGSSRHPQPEDVGDDRRRGMGLPRHGSLSRPAMFSRLPRSRYEGLYPDPWRAALGGCTSTHALRRAS